MFVVDLEGATLVAGMGRIETVAVLDGMKSEGRLYGAVSGPVRPGGLDAKRTFP
jgi:hypothetical protein